MMNLREFFELRVEINSDKPFLDFEGEVVSYEQFDRRINRFANALLELGVEKGDRVCLMLPNVPDFLYAWFATAKIGAVMVPINTAFKGKEVSYIVKHSEAVGILVDQAQLKTVDEIRELCPTLQWTACIDPSEETKEIRSFPTITDAMSEELRAIDIKEDETAQILYTSGTTGFPKGAVHTHRHFILTGEAFVLCADISPEDKLMIILPLFHANAQYYSTMGALAGNACVILTRRFSASHFWDQAVRFGATEFNFIAAIGRILAGRPQEEFRPEHRIKTAYGAPITPDVYDAFKKRFHIENVIDGYGLTEVPRVSQNPIGGPIKVGSIGLPARHPDPGIRFSEIKITDDDGTEVNPGEIGEITVRSPVMIERYFKDEERTQEAIRNGWFHTGDLGYKDDDGYFFFVDRKKDIIRRKGENISAMEVESVINAHPKIQESAVVPVPSALGEDEVMACVVCAECRSITPEEIILWCKARLADFKVPRYVKFFDSLPKTPTQRIAKYIIRADENLLLSSHDMDSSKERIGNRTET